MKLVEVFRLTFSYIARRGHVGSQEDMLPSGELG